jgi:hypothetical protein
MCSSRPVVPGPPRHSVALTTQNTSSRTAIATISKVVISAPPGARAADAQPCFAITTAHNAPQVSS